MTIEEQVHILELISQIMHDSADGQYEELNCRFEYKTYEGGWSVGTEYSYVRDGLYFSEHMNDVEGQIPSYVHKLHELMKSHTGGDWKNFLLTIDSSGKANTKFKY